MRKLVHALDKIDDDSVVETFKAVFDELDRGLLSRMKGRFYEITLGPGTTLWPHNLGYAPRDVIQTSLISSDGLACSWVWNFSKFTKTHLSVTVTCSTGKTATCRAFVGKYEDD